MALRTIHVLHVTSQHQWNLHLQFTFSRTVRVSYPRPQHKSSHPSTPGEVALHSLPCVPRDPVFLLGLQKSWDSSEYTRSTRPGGLIVGPSGMKRCPSLLGITLAAPSNLSFSRFPTSRKGGILLQHVLRVQEPESPWHLHSVRIKFFTACKQSFMILKFVKNRVYLNSDFFFILGVFICSNKWT